MKWPLVRKEPPRDETKRFVARFLLLPLSINGQTRWLERAVWLEQYDALTSRWIPQKWHGTSEGDERIYPRGR